MRKEYRRAVRSLFTDMLLAANGAFVVEKPESELLWNGETVYRWRPDGLPDGFRGYALLVPSPTGHQAFTVEVGWSGADRFPVLGMRPSVMLAEGVDPPLEATEGFVRLGDVIDGQDRWWQLPDPAVERPGDLAALQQSLEPIEAGAARGTAEPLVEDAVRHLCGVGVAFLGRMAERHLGGADS